MDDPFVLAGESFSSRLIMGTGGAPSPDVLDRALAASGTELTIVAMRRVSPATSGSLLDVLTARGIRVLPNTAGCFTAAEAVRVARPPDDRPPDGRACPGVYRPVPARAESPTSCVAR